MTRALSEELSYVIAFPASTEAGMMNGLDNDQQHRVSLVFRSKFRVMIDVGASFYWP